MERGVVVGGLMILGSLLLAASLNRSAMEEVAPISSVSAPESAAAPKPSGSSPAASADHPGFYAGEDGLSASQRAGREIWYKATADNSRFHTYRARSTPSSTRHNGRRSRMKSSRNGAR